MNIMESPRNTRAARVAYYYFMIVWWTRAVCRCDSFSTTPSTTTATTDGEASVKNNSKIIDTSRAVATIRAGRVYQHMNFVSSDEIDLLLDDIQRLRDNGSFVPSGLSDTSRGAQQAFGQQDRTVSPVTWWRESLLRLQQQEHEQQCEDTSDRSSYLAPDNVVATRLNELRLLLADALNRPSLRDHTLAHECYYSMSGPGSFLPRHMDEKHEDLKGPKGWLLPSRRSLSWLLYLSDSSTSDADNNNDEQWSIETNGGALRSYPPQQLLGPTESTHDGNLQIGWLHNQQQQLLLLHKNNNGKVSGSLPVYMDCWYRNTADTALSADPYVILYTVVPPAMTERKVLTKPWLTEKLPTNLLPMDFIKQMAAHDAAATTTSLTSDNMPLLFLQSQDARDFSLIEDRQAWDQGNDPAGSQIEDIAPLRGSLVIFDSVLVPHQVQVVKQGQRIALAGWFHEQTQEIPLEILGSE